MKIFLLLFSMYSLVCNNVEKRKCQILLAGDSTISIKEFKAYPETGWGMPFQYFWDSTVTVINNAKNGRSTKTFIKEGLWQKTIENTHEGDFVIIQFGHNDESIEKKERYATPDTFKMNLNKFITDVRLKKATPILVTPVSRRKFKDGKVQPTHIQYSALVKDVALAQNTLFIDLDSLSMNLYQSFGEENSKLLFLQLNPGEHPNYPDGKIDNTHFSELGARLIAQIVLQEIKKMNLDLNHRIVKPAPKK
jgi:lysophospholipase L1-like esterase